MDSIGVTEPACLEGIQAEINKVINAMITEVTSAPGENTNFKGSEDVPTTLKERLQSASLARYRRTSC